MNYLYEKSRPITCIYVGENLHALRKNDIPGQKNERKKHHAAPETKAGHGDTEEPARFLYGNVTAFSEGGGIGRDGEKTGSVL